MDEVHDLVHVDEVKDGGGISAAIFFVANYANRFEESNPILGGACAGPQVYREQLYLHLRCGVLHHQVVDLFCVLVPPFLFIVGMFVFPLRFRLFDKVGRVGQIGGKTDCRCFELTNGKCCEWAVKLQALWDVLGDGLDVEV